MSRDYKHPPRRPAEKKSGGSNPMVIGITIGLFLGLALSLAVALFVTRGPNPFSAKEKPPADSTASAPAEEKKGARTPDGQPLDDGLTKTPNKPRFDFYTILPGKEEPATDQEFKKAAEQPAADKGKAKERYFLQVGSFTNETDADNLKAKLALMGLEANIQTSTIPDKGVWHRVRVGPFSSVDDLNKVRATLTQNSIPSTLVKIKEGSSN